MKRSSLLIVAALTVLVLQACFCILAALVLLLPTRNKFEVIKQEAKLVSHNNISQEVISEIERTAQLLSPVNSSATNLAGIITSSLDADVNLSFSAIETHVAPVLFQALSTIPHLSQISYVGSDGLLFAYYSNGSSQPLAVYSNSSLSRHKTSVPSDIPKHTWYTQSVNRDSGKLYGEAMTASVFQAALFSTGNVRNGNRSSLQTGWENFQDRLLLNTAGMDRNIGVISLGFPVKSLSGFFSGIDFHGGNLHLATKDGEVVVDEGIPNTRLAILGDSVSFELLDPNGTQVGRAGNVTCKPPNTAGTLEAPVLLNILETKYKIHCSPIDIVGVQSVYVLALPEKGMERIVDHDIKFAFLLMILMFGVMVVSVVTSVVLIIKAAWREMFLRAELIKQMEATQQAERKSMNKTQAFANASHDVRASLAGITGLIDMCREEVAPGSELESNLVQMEACAKDLLGILNSILDASKIEAGKMQLEEEEFDVAQLVEDAVDLYHPVGMKKGVDVVLDPCDGSVPKFSTAKGDRTKLKQILCNLLSNAVKFTPVGHVAVRAWAKKKPSSNNSIFSDSRSSPLHCLSCLFLRNVHEALESMNAVQENPNSVEFVFEVDDTGQGIPKDKQNYVFENYVQVKETALAQEGTGLGLGIVQSLVRLMGGEIQIIDKEMGEKGTCFRFNVFLSTCEADSSDTNSNNIAEGEDIESHGGFTPGNQPPGPSTRTTSPKREASHVILFVQSEARQRILRKFMVSLGIRVSAVNEWESLQHSLKKVKQKLSMSPCTYSSSGKSDSSSSFSLSRPVLSPNSKDVPLSALDGTDHLSPPLCRRTNLRGVTNFVLIVIDVGGGPFRELSRAVVEFRRDLKNSACYRIIWLDKPGAGNIHSKGLDKDILPTTDLIISKPFHGSRLYHVIGLLPEFGGTLPPEERRQNPFRVEKTLLPKSKNFEEVLVTDRTFSLPVPRLGETLEQGSTSGEKPLSGNRILVAEDNAVQMKLATARATRLGAEVETCENGKKALELVCKGLLDLRGGGGGRRRDGETAPLPYDYILMDCEMPEMDGIEATRRIREEERAYGVHIPIIALTAHTGTGTEAKRIMEAIEAGMDFHLVKPINGEQLMVAIRDINSKFN